MSWSLMFIGNPENIVKALEEHSEKLNGASKTEFDSALPHIVGIVQQNFNKAEGGTAPVLKVSASGHGYFSNEGPVNSSCQVSIESFYATLV
jgi:hypothetical protein